jgi:hypothetical protein
MGPADGEVVGRRDVGTLIAEFPATANRCISHPMPNQRRTHAPQAVAHVRPIPETLDFDPSPCVPTLEEIEIADELRHDLELKYLGKADPCWDS